MSGCGRPGEPDLVPGQRGALCGSCRPWW